MHRCQSGRTHLGTRHGEQDSTTQPISWPAATMELHHAWVPPQLRNQVSRGVAESFGLPVRQGICRVPAKRHQGRVQDRLPIARCTWTTGLDYWSARGLLDWTTGVHVDYWTGLLECTWTTGLDYWSARGLLDWTTGVHVDYWTGLLECTWTTGLDYWSARGLLDWTTGVHVDYWTGLLECTWTTGLDYWSARGLLPPGKTCLQPRPIC